MSEYDLLVRRARVVNAPGGLQGRYDVAIAGGTVVALEPELAPDRAAAVIDAGDRVVMPGLVDTHVHVSGRFGAAVGYRMLARAGVTAILDMAGDPDDLLRDLPGAGCGIAAAVIVPVIPGDSVAGEDPPRTEVEALLERSLERGALGLKALGGHYPITPAALDHVIGVCAERGVHCGVHAGSTETGSDVTGLEELMAIAGERPVHIAHVNSYCRGQIEDPVAEAARAVAALARSAVAWSESYLATINAAEASCGDGVPDSRVVRTCLRLGGYPETRGGLVQAIGAGWARIHVDDEDGIRLAAPEEGVTEFERRDTHVGVSFPVNPAASALALGLARRLDGGFAVDAFATDGGSLPRNTTLRQGVGLVAAGLLTLPDLVEKASREPARALGLDRKGRIAAGADADLVVVEPDGDCAVVIAGGRVIVADGRIVEPGGGRLLCTPAGTAAARAGGVEVAT